jgi:hypothetical protein
VGEPIGGTLVVGLIAVGGGIWLASTQPISDRALGTKK